MPSRRHFFRGLTFSESIFAATLDFANHRVYYQKCRRGLPEGGHETEFPLPPAA
jgi:hypothetical protein